MRNEMLHDLLWTDSAAANQQDKRRTHLLHQRATLQSLHRKPHESTCKGGKHSSRNRSLRYREIPRPIFALTAPQAKMSTGCMTRMLNTYTEIQSLFPHTHTPIQRYNRCFFSLCPHTPTQLYTIAADDMCTCMFLYVYLVMKNHIECDQLLHKSRALKNYTWLQFVIEIFKSEIQLFTFHEWQPSKRLEAKCRCRAIPMDQRVGIRAHVVQTNVF